MISKRAVTAGRWAGPAAVVGGLLWVPYGVLEMLEPWGAATVYRENVGYELITDVPLFVAYSLPGGLALLLTSLGLLGVLARLGPPSGRSSRSGGIGRILVYVALGLGVLSLAGVVALFDPLFTAGRIFGSLALGAATLLAGFAARHARAARGWTLALLALGIMGLLLLPLWPLVYALEWLPEGAGAAFMALFGLGWVALGYALRSGEGEQHAIHARGVPARKTPPALQPDDSGGRLANAAVACGLLAFPLWLLSFSWVPFALAGREVGSVWYIILVGEAGALMAALLAVGFGCVARRRARPGTAHHRRALRGLVTGVIALVLVVGLNILGAVFS